MLAMVLMTQNRDGRRTFSDMTKTEQEEYLRNAGWRRSDRWGDWEDPKVPGIFYMLASAVWIERERESDRKRCHSTP
jgi:hypothetical protein